MTNLCCAFRLPGFLPRPVTDGCQFGLWLNGRRLTTRIIEDTWKPSMCRLCDRLVCTPCSDHASVHANANRSPLFFPKHNPLPLVCFPLK